MTNLGICFSGKQISCFNHKDFVTCVLFHPENDDLFLGGTSNSGIFAWDTRADKVNNNSSVNHCEEV